MAESESVDAEQARAEVREYDLDTGALRRALAVPSADMQTGDVALDGRGGILVSDGRTGALLRSSPDSDTLSIVLPTGTLGSPQGIVVTDDGRSAWVADYALGLVRVDLEAATAAVVHAPTTLLGSDGLLSFGDDLFVVQNGIAPNRVLKLTPSRDGKRIEEFDVLLASHPDFAEPTGAVMVDGKLYLVANSQWPHFAGGEVSRPEELRGPIILEVEF
jgi:DNA-binding beta-propeller fold protein YncE